jgi:hypothetical protein
VKWFRRAAASGQALAQSNLGVCYLEGKGVAQDYAVAVQWFRQAADHGDAAAQSNLAACYVDGHGVPRDYTKALSGIGAPPIKARRRRKPSWAGFTSLARPSRKITPPPSGGIGVRPSGATPRHNTTSVCVISTVAA